MTATLRAVPESELPGSVSVLNSQTLRDAGQQNFEDVHGRWCRISIGPATRRCPGISRFAASASCSNTRARPNPSVGFLIDDIDFSGLGMAATLFDVDHIEVLRGPQGTLYGANALAGLIYVRSAEPADRFGGRVELDAGDYGERSYGAVVTGPVPALDSAFRFAVQQYTSDGFYHNAYLDRDTEQPQRTDFARQVALSSPTINGGSTSRCCACKSTTATTPGRFDGSRTTESDHPGVDRQYSTGISARATYGGFAPRDAHHDRHLRGHDGQLCVSTATGAIPFSGLRIPSITPNIRCAIARRAAWRCVSRDTPEHGLAWLFGVYAFQLREGLSDTSAGLYEDPLRPDAELPKPAGRTKPIPRIEQRALRPARRRCRAASALVGGPSRRAAHDPLRRLDDESRCADHPQHVRSGKQSLGRPRLARLHHRAPANSSMR